MSLISSHARWPDPSLLLILVSGTVTTSDTDGLTGSLTYSPNLRFQTHRGQQKSEMSIEETATAAYDTSESSSRTDETRFADADPSTDRSLNSLIDNENKSGDCVEIECAGFKNQILSLSCSENEKLEKKKSYWGIICRSVLGCILLLASISSFIFTPLDFMLWEKLNMRPGLPPYEWWRDPPDEVKLRVYVFNVTNHEDFLKGKDEKINLQEIGPVVYLEKLIHSNIKFNDNSTLTYTATRTPIYLPDKNTIDLNSTIIVPNLAVLGLASYLHSAPYLIKVAFRFLVNSHNGQFFVEKTIHEYLWDYRESILDTSRSLAPGLVPVNNMGVLARMYSDFSDEMSVYIGPQWGHERFFQIHRFRGEPQLPGYDAEVCPDRIFGSTEGVLYRQRMTKDDVLLYWRKSVCKLMPLYFDKELVTDGILLYRYNLSESVYERVKNGTDCYDTTPSLPSGLSDGSKCYYDFPMVLSYPHFYTGLSQKEVSVTGLKPDRGKHNSFAVVEPLTGTPFLSIARMQSNLRVHDLSGFSSAYDRFSNLVLPMFWAEYNQEGLPKYISRTVYFMVVVLPPLSAVVSIVALIFGCYLIAKLILYHKLKNRNLRNLLLFKSKGANELTKNKLFLFEKEEFLKTSS